MYVNIVTSKTFNVQILKVCAEVYSWEDATVNGEEDVDGTLIPCRDGDYWNPSIDIETGKILNWPQGTTAEIHYKVCDGCAWSILDRSEDVVLYSEGDYVPDTLCPKELGYGDYIIMDINEDGIIKDWDFKISDFTSEQ